MKENLAESTQVHSESPRPQSPSRFPLLPRAADFILLIMGQEESQPLLAYRKFGIGQFFAVCHDDTELSPL